MRQDELNSKHYIADEGKVFRCKIHNIIMGNEIFLGRHRVNGKSINDTIDNYEEIDDVQKDINNNEE